MKLLVIGIDGGTQKILEGMPMPFTQKLLAESKSRILKEDLLTRGWAQILTGEHASQNKSFYQRPLCNRTYEFTQDYSGKEMLESGESKPLWQKLNLIGQKVGMVNVPTTGLTEKLEGFIVPGGGGGKTASSNDVENLVQPSRFITVLKKWGYISDIRGPGEAITVREYLLKIDQAQEAQKNTFMELAKIEKPDFGFHCFRITTVVQYLVKSEIDKCIASRKKAEIEGREYRASDSVHEAINEHYQHLDSCIKELFDKLKPENYIFVSDHSTSLFEYEGNLDVWLEREGYLKRLTGFNLLSERAKNFLKMKAKDYLTKLVLLKPPSQVTRKPKTRFSKKQTLAFGTFYDTGNFAGIYVNDEVRFGGRVKSESIELLVRQICAKFNQTEEAALYKLSAAPYRKAYKSEKYENMMPDIKITKPDNIYFSGKTGCFIQNNNNLLADGDALVGMAYPQTGLKGSEPLFHFNENLERFISAKDPHDLRLVYRMICRYFENAEAGQ